METVMRKHVEKKAVYHLENVEWYANPWEGVTAEQLAALPKEFDLETDAPGDEAAEGLIVCIAAHDKYGAHLQSWSPTRLA